MRILLAAPVSFDRITYFVSDYFSGLARALTKLGHSVRLVKTSEIIYNPIIPKWIEREYLTFRHYLKKVVDAPHDLLLMNQLLRAVEEFHPDILLLHVFDTSYLSRVLRRIRAKGVTVCFWLGQHPAQVSAGVHELLRQSDLTLYYDRTYTDYYRQVLGVENLFVLPLGCDLDRFDAIAPDDKFVSGQGVDVCFVGLFDAHREKFLMALRDFDLGIWSWNINEYDTPLKKYHRGNAFGDDLIRIYKSSKIIINIHRSFEKSGGNYRLFEIPAAGAFQLVDNRPGLTEYFAVGSEVATFEDENDLRNKVAYFLTHESMRQKIASAGYERVRNDHTLERRMERLLSNIERDLWNRR